MHFAVTAVMFKNVSKNIILHEVEMVKKNNEIS